MSPSDAGGRAARSALLELPTKWRQTKAQIDTFHATMGTGYGACADELEAELEAAGLAAGDRPSLFQPGDFTLHSGEHATWKIDCDALTDADVKTLARMMMEVLPPFGSVEGVPRGGLRLAHHLESWVVDDNHPLLIVDDVATTGASMEQHRAGRAALGCVVFARGPVPSWVTLLFTMDRADLRGPSMALVLVALNLFAASEVWR